MYGYLVHLYCSVLTNKPIHFVRFKTKIVLFCILTDILFVLCMNKKTVLTMIRMIRLQFRVKAVKIACYDF